MEKLLQKMTDELIQINTFLGNTAFSAKDIANEKENLRDLSQTIKKLAVWTEEIKNCPLGDENKFCEKIVELHLLMANLTWYFDNLHENVKKIITTYPFSEKFRKDN